jgi:hypothetical protein
MHCGVERWHVKTLTDPDASAVNFSPQVTTVEQLNALTRPAGISRGPSSDQRYGPTELQTYTVQAWLVGWRPELDQDFILGLQDVNSIQTMRAESVSPRCSNACMSAKRAEYAQVRKLLEHCLPVSQRFLRPRDPTKLEVTGVAFFDFPHGQYASAPNGIELHPILSVKWLSGPCPAVPINPG